MQFTLRQRQRLTALAGLWVLLTGLCAIAGPFGTHEAMTLTGRVFYWAFVVAVSVLASLLVARFEPVGLPKRILAWALYAVGLALVIFGLNTMLFPPSVSGRNLLYLVGTVGVSVLAINGMVYLVRTKIAGVAAPDATPVDPQAKFLRRLPLELRAPLVRIEAQDHYLNVVTAKGSGLILLRLAEAVEELADVGGLQTHRSHWVMLNAVQGHSRTGGRDILQMSDGSRVPVARTRRDAARDAGLF